MTTPRQPSEDLIASAPVDDLEPVIARDLNDLAELREAIRYRDDRTVYILDIRAARSGGQGELYRRYTVAADTLDHARAQLHDVLDTAVFRFNEILDEDNAREIAAGIDAARRESDR